MTVDPRSAVVAEDFDVRLPSGRLRARRFGSPRAPLVLCIPGLSANLAGFDFLGERLAGDHRQVVALDLRGRGRSDVTGAGSYGWVNHARDVMELAGELGASSCSLIGQSMGAGVAMVCAQLAPASVDKVVLVDLAGVPDASSVLPVARSIERLGAVYPSADAAIDLIKQLGLVPEWTEYWERYFRYELHEVEGGVSPSSDRDAVFEDSGYGMAMYSAEPGPPIRALWEHLTMPTLLLRATEEIMPGFGHIVPEEEGRRFVASVPGSRMVEVDANHYAINMHPVAAEAIEEFLSA
ncbi:MAG TPA: alpha/beta hydrolase [Acidimicrobiales bacterium]|nr:alpha/beta hydrolase [Acidimicrobiales bacterium]